MSSAEPETPFSLPEPLTVARRCRALLMEYSRIYADKIPVRSDDMPPFPVHGHDAIHRALKCGLETTDGVIHFISLGQPWCAATVVRAYFELTLRITWHNKRENGWKELLGYWAGETLSAADRKLKDCGSDPITPELRAQLNGYKTHARQTRNIKLDTMLEELAVNQPTTASRKQLKKTYAELLKGGLYQAAHMNLTFLSLEWSGNDDPINVGQALMTATCWLVMLSAPNIGWKNSYTAEFMNKHLGAGAVRVG
jgi:hypothetical protein